MEEMREVLAGERAGVRWTVSAGREPSGGLYTSVYRTCGDARATSGMGGPALHPGQVVNTWIGQADGTPVFVLVRAAPEVGAVAIVLASGARQEVELSPVVQEFGLRFGAAPLPDDDPPSGMEISVPGSDPQMGTLRRPPRPPEPVDPDPG